MVQASATLSPERRAERLATRFGRLSEGGCGAPGIPHPATSNAAEREAAIADLHAKKPKLLADCMALPV
jgi:hypothetical protein